MAFAELSPTWKVHCAISGVIPIRANVGIEIKDIKTCLEVADTMIKSIDAVSRMNKTGTDKGADSNEESKSALVIVRHLSGWEYSRQANIYTTKKAMMGYTPRSLIGCVNPSVTSLSMRYRSELNL